MAHDRNVTVGVRVTPQEAEKLHALADRHFIKPSEMIRTLINAAFELEVLKTTH